MPAVLASATGSNWTAGGSIFTFYFPIGLFVVIAAVLWAQFGRPHKIPGHQSLATSASGAASAASRPETAAITSTAGQDDEPADPASPSAGDTG